MINNLSLGGKRGIGLLKRRKRSPKRRQTTFFLSLMFIVIIIIGPILWHMERLRKADTDYNVQEVQVQLQWLDVHGGLFNRLGLIKDAKLRLELNVGSKDLELKLAEYQDEKHQFWLFLLNLQEGKLTEAQNVIGQFANTPLGQLGQGLISLSKGNADESRRLLADGEIDWQSLPLKEQSLRHLILTQAAIMLGDDQLTRAEFRAAQQLEPNNPACLSVGFDVALAQGQSAKALELSHLIDAQTWRPKNSLFETKKAVLAFHENDLTGLSVSLSALKELHQGDACIYYVNAIQALGKGQLQEGKDLLERALKSGLDDGLKADAQRALEQVAARQKAEPLLQVVGGGNLD